MLRSPFRLFPVLMLVLSCYCAISFAPWGRRRIDIVCQVALANQNKKPLWSGTTLTGKLVTSVDQANSVFARVDVDEKLRRVIQILLKTLAVDGNYHQSAKFMKVYQPIYDRLIAFSGANLEFAKFANRHLPKEGLIADLACGSGIHGARILYWELQRELLAIDFNRSVMDFAKLKFQAIEQYLTTSPGKWTGKWPGILNPLPLPLPPRINRRVQFTTLTGSQGDLTALHTLAQKNQLLDGAFMIGSLYTIKYKAQPTVLQLISRSLRSGGVFVFIEQVNEGMPDVDAATLQAERIIRDAIANGAKVTDQEIALIKYLYKWSEPGAKTRFKRRETLINLISPSNLGFEVIEERTFQNDRYMGWAFRKK